MSSRHAAHHHGRHHGSHRSHHGHHHGSHGHHSSHGHAHGPHAARSAARHAADAAHRKAEAARIAREAADKQAKREAARHAEKGHGDRHQHATPRGLRSSVKLDEGHHTRHSEPHALKAASTPSGHGSRDVSPNAKAQMDRLTETAGRSAAHRRPGGWCYRAVKKFIASTPGGYGGLNAGNIYKIPQARARDFADFMNRDGNAAKYGLRKLDISNPYDAPKGALVVVAPGTPGTRHPTAGDITIAAGGGRFYNDGNMGYGGPRNFPPGNRHVLGIYVPAN